MSDLVITSDDLHASASCSRCLRFRSISIELPRKSHHSRGFQCTATLGLMNCPLLRAVHPRVQLVVAIIRKVTRTNYGQYGRDVEAAQFTHIGHQSEIL